MYVSILNTKTRHIVTKAIKLHALSNSEYKQCPQIAREVVHKREHESEGSLSSKYARGEPGRASCPEGE